MPELFNSSGVSRLTIIKDASLEALNKASEISIGRSL
jgi:hypothetical protein